MKNLNRKYWLVLTIIFLVIILIWFFLPYFLVPEDVKQKAIELCIQGCKYWNMTPSYWEDGPCLSNSIPNATDWVCDVAHWPRQSVDDVVKNQCSAFREGKAHHFVEVDTNCNLIRAV